MKSFYLVLFIAMTACKTTSGVNSALKATAEQKENLRLCIVKTVMQSYADSLPKMEAVRAFADDLVGRAPEDNDTAYDYAFEAYVTDMGCDPDRTGESSTYGTMIVGEWAISPLNPDNSEAFRADQQHQ